MIHRTIHNCLICLLPYLVCDTPIHALDLSSPNKENFSYFGSAVTGISDLNNDGVNDLAIAAYNEDLDPVLQDAGRVYIFDGANGVLLKTLVSPHPEFDGHFGHALAPVPDLTGDGLLELAISAPEEDAVPGVLDGGRVYIFDPAAGKPLLELQSPRSSPGGNFGYSLAADDLGGTSGPVILIGANRERPTPEATITGSAYLFRLTDGALIHDMRPPDGFVPSRFGWAGTIGGDYDADGIRDVIVTDMQANSVGDATSSEGAAFIFSGFTGLPLAKLVSPNMEPLGGFGYAVAAVPDLNGDGIMDYAIGADAEDPGSAPTSAGRVYVFAGPDALLAELKSPFQRSFGAFGQCIVGLPDLDEDGAGEILIGAPGENISRDSPSSGVAYLFAGRTRRVIRIYASPGGAVQGGLFGLTMAAPGDLNGDGLIDFLIGAQWEWPPEGRPAFAGRAYTIDPDSKRSIGPGPTRDVAAYLLGRPIDPTGMDFNGDQIIDAADLMFSAQARP